MPARKVFALGVGHVRRRGMEPGSKAEALAEPKDTQYVQLSELDWRVLTALKKEFTPQELTAAAARPADQFWLDRAALFHWAVPKGRELEAGMQVARFHIMTHAYWREGGAEFNHVNVMGVIHGTDKQMVLAHKAAIDAHLNSSEGGQIPIAYTNVFWGGRSEIKPSEISPLAYAAWLRQQNIDPAAMKESPAK